MAGVTCSDTHKFRTTRGRATCDHYATQEHVESFILLLVICRATCWSKESRRSNSNLRSALNHKSYRNLRKDIIGRTITTASVRTSNSLDNPKFTIREIGTITITLDRDGVKCRGSFAYKRSPSVRANL